MAISDHEAKGNGNQPRACTGRKPAIRQTTITSSPWSTGNRRSAQRAADHDLQARDRRDKRLLQKSELPIPQKPSPEKMDENKHRHADYARRHKLQIIAIAGALEIPAQGRSPAPADTAAAGRATRRSAPASACSASVRAARECRCAHRLPPLHIFANCRIWAAGSAALIADG